MITNETVLYYANPSYVKSCLCMFMHVDGAM